jgi:hypothetical protein
MRDRVHWRNVRERRQKEDRENNIRLAEALLYSPHADDYAIAISLVDWKLVPCSPVAIEPYTRPMSA